MANRRLTTEQLEELKRCRDDVVYFITRHGRLRHTSLGDIAWDNPYDYQVGLWRALREGKNVVVNKSRQIGCSWAICAFAVWLICFHPNVDVLFLSAKEKYAIELLKKAKFIFNNLPYFLKPLVTVNSTVQFTVTFKSRDGDDWRISDSTIHSLTTTTDTGRGFSARLVVMDEAAFLPNSEVTWTAVLPTTTHGGQVAIISTPNGVNNFFHRLWGNTTTGSESGFVPIRAYYKDCGYDDAWLRRVTVGMTTQQILQEYELQFVTAHSPFFDLVQLARCYFPDGEHPEILDSTGRNIKATTRINFTGVDTSEGNKCVSGEPDFHSVVTLNEYGVQVGAWHSNKLRLEDFAGRTERLPDGRNVEIEGVTTKIHREFPGIVAIERNGAGETTYNRHQCPEDGFSEVVARRTTGSQWAGGGTKIRMLNALRLAIAGKQIVVTDYFTYLCLQSFEDKGGNKAEASDGAFDDPVIALALAWGELQRWGGLQFDLPDETATGQRIVSLTPQSDLKPDELAEVLSLRDAGHGPMLEPSTEAPGDRRFTDDVDQRVRPPWVRQSTQHR